MEEKFVFWLEEISANQNDLVGKKCANLGEMTRAGIRVPHGFVLSLKAYNEFLGRSGALEKMKAYVDTFRADPENLTDVPKYEEASSVMRSIVESGVMPDDMEATLITYYADLCRKSGCVDIPVATRSAGTTSHPGQYETYLNISGREQLIKNIIKVWSSTFNTRSLISRARKDLPLYHDPIGVAVLQMVDARAAGVMFTLNPLNGDVSKIVIQGNWGLGESVVSGVTQADEWIVDKVTLEIISKRTATKVAEHVVDPVTGNVVMIESPQERRDALCLKDEEVAELAKLGKSLERHFETPQDIEWAITGDLPFPQNVFALQTRPETIWSGKTEKPKITGKGKPFSFLADIAVGKITKKGP